MKFNYTKLINSDSLGGYSVVSIKKDKAWIELPLLSTKTANYIRILLEEDLRTGAKKQNLVHFRTNDPRCLTIKAKAFQESTGVGPPTFFRLFGISSYRTIQMLMLEKYLPRDLGVAFQYVIDNKLIAGKLTPKKQENVRKRFEKSRVTGLAVYQLRRKLGLSQMAFGKAMGYSRQRVSYIEASTPSIIQSLFLRYYYQF